MGGEISHAAMEEDRDLPFAQNEDDACASAQQWTIIERILQRRLEVMRKNHTMLIVDQIINYLKIHRPNMPSSLAADLTDSVLNSTGFPPGIVEVMRQIPRMHPLQEHGEPHESWNFQVIDHIGRLLLVYSLWNNELQTIGNEYNLLFTNMQNCLNSRRDIIHQQKNQLDQCQQLYQQAMLENTFNVNRNQQSQSDIEHQLKMCREQLMNATTTIRQQHIEMQSRIEELSEQKMRCQSDLYTLQAEAEYRCRLRLQRQQEDCDAKLDALEAQSQNVSTAMRTMGRAFVQGVCGVALTSAEISRNAYWWFVDYRDRCNAKPAAKPTAQSHGTQNTESGSPPPMPKPPAGSRNRSPPPKPRPSAPHTGGNAKPSAKPAGYSSTNGPRAPRSSRDMPYFGESNRNNGDGSSSSQNDRRRQASDRTDSGEERAPKANRTVELDSRWRNFLLILENNYRTASGNIVGREYWENRFPTENPDQRQTHIRDILALMATPDIDATDTLLRTMMLQSHGDKQEFELPPALKSRKTEIFQLVKAIWDTVRYYRN